MPYIRGVVSRADVTAEAGTPIRFVASTTGVARDGLVIDSNAWKLDNYRANPVVLWAHDYSGARPPIGRADVFTDGSNLMADVTFDQGDEFARSVERKYRDGFLHSVSVGWDTQSVEPSNDPNVRGVVTRADLLDISAVPVPGDPNALIARAARALAVIAEGVDVPADPEPQPDAAGWSEAAAEMARLLADTAHGKGYDFEERYRRLARAYEKAGKTPPEYIEPATIEAMGLDAVRGLLVEGEDEFVPDAFDNRAGAVLSRENVADLTDAVAAITRVIERGKKKADEDMVHATDAQPTDSNVGDTLARLYEALGGNRG